MIWIKPERFLLGQAFWYIESSNRYFVLQQRKGHNAVGKNKLAESEAIKRNSFDPKRASNEELQQMRRSVSTSATVLRGHSRSGFGGLFVSTIHSIFDTRPPPYRIVYQCNLEDGQIAFVIFIGMDGPQILPNWECLERTILPILGSLDNEDNLEKFLLNNLEGLLTATAQNEAGTGKPPGQLATNKATLANSLEIQKDFIFYDGLILDSSLTDAFMVFDEKTGSVSLHKDICVDQHIKTLTRLGLDQFYVFFYGQANICYRELLVSRLQFHKKLATEMAEKDSIISQLGLTHHIEVLLYFVPLAYPKIYSIGWFLTNKGILANSHEIQNFYDTIVLDSSLTDAFMVFDAKIGLVSLLKDICCDQQIPIGDWIKLIKLLMDQSVEFYLASDKECLLAIKISQSIRLNFHLVLDALHHLPLSLESAQILSLIQCLCNRNDCHLFFHLQLKHDAFLAQTITITALLMEIYSLNEREIPKWGTNKPFFTFFAFLSFYGSEQGMIEDSFKIWQIFSKIATFRFIPANLSISQICIPQIYGFRSDIKVSIPLHQNVLFTKVVLSESTEDEPGELTKRSSVSVVDFIASNLINSKSTMSLLYECINTVIEILISISSEGVNYTHSIQLCIQKLSVLIEDGDFCAQNESKEISARDFLPNLIFNSTYLTDYRIYFGGMYGGGNEDNTDSTNVVQNDIEFWSKIDWTGIENLKSLKPTMTRSCWVYQDVVDLFFIAENIPAFNSYYARAFAEKGILPDTDLLSSPKIFVPINLKDRQWMLATIDIKGKIIKIKDSYSEIYGVRSNFKLGKLQQILNILMAMANESKTNIGSKSDWKLAEDEAIPQQVGGKDCGVFIMMFAYYEAKDRPITFTQEQINAYRQKIFTICANHLGRGSNEQQNGQGTSTANKFEDGELRLDKRQLQLRRRANSGNNNEQQNQNNVQHENNNKEIGNEVTTAATNEDNAEKKRRRRPIKITMPQRRRATFTECYIARADALVVDQDGDFQCIVRNKKGETWHTDRLPLNEAADASIRAATFQFANVFGDDNIRNKLDEMEEGRVRDSIKLGLNELAEKRMKDDKELEKEVRDCLEPMEGDVSNVPFHSVSNAAGAVKQSRHNRRRAKIRQMQAERKKKEWERQNREQSI